MRLQNIEMQHIVLAILLSLHLYIYDFSLSLSFTLFMHETFYYEIKNCCLLGRAFVIFNAPSVGDRRLHLHARACVMIILYRREGRTPPHVLVFDMDISRSLGYRGIRHTIYHISFASIVCFTV